MASKRLNITQREFLRSFKRHYHTYEMISDDEKYEKDKRLILFYAVECGLKYWIMKNEMLKDYEELDAYAKNKGMGDIGHDIKKMLKDRNMDRKYMLKNLEISTGQRIDVKNLNQFWRYGAKTHDTETESKNVKVLDKIARDLIKRV